LANSVKGNDERLIQNADAPDRGRPWSSQNLNIAEPTMPDTAQAPVPSPKKRIAVFLDGTWNTVNDNTNVWRLKSLCASRSRDGLEQRVYYSAGVGTKFGERLSGGMFGSGLNDEIIQAYEWLIDHHNDGDELFIFGFSRGAYTARSLSGLISKCGLLIAGASLSVNQLYARYRRGSEPRTIRQLISERDDGRTKFPLEEEWMLKYSRAIDIEFIGVWDTVGALGLPFGNLPWFGRSDMQFLNTGIRVSNKFAFHALAIDEHRKAFAPTPWTVDTATPPSPHAPPPRPLSQVEQRWFVGAHANVGGGCQSDLLAQAPLKWMMAKSVLQGLSFRREVELDGNLATSPISDSYSEFMEGWYKRATFGQRYYREIGQRPVKSSQTTMRQNINETIDATVFDRWRTDSTYRPPNLAHWASNYNISVDSIPNSVRADDPTIPVA
jgi:uncharacterized protein (DUF2235 family)